MTISTDRPARGVLHRKAGSGQQVWFSGDVYTIVLTTADTDGALGVVYASVPPGGGPAHHYHAEHDELFYLIDGELTFSEGGTDFTATAGDTIWLTRGTVHRFVNQGLFPATMIVLYTPGGPERLFVDGGDEPVAGQQPPPWGPERIDERMRDLLQKYDHHFTDPPSGAL